MKILCLRISVILILNILLVASVITRNDMNRLARIKHIIAKQSSNYNAFRKPEHENEAAKENPDPDLLSKIKKYFSKINKAKTHTSKFKFKFQSKSYFKMFLKF